MASRKQVSKPPEVRPGQIRTSTSGATRRVLVGERDERGRYPLYAQQRGLGAEWFRWGAAFGAARIQQGWETVESEGNPVPEPRPRPKPPPDWKAQALAAQERSAHLEQALARAQVVCRDLDRLLGEVLAGGTP